VLATERQSPKTMPVPQEYPQTWANTAEQRGDRDLDRGTGQRNPADRQQVVQREVDPHPEHQQDHADLGELLGQRDVGDEPWGIRSHRHARQEIAYDRRQAQPHREQAEQKREAETRGDGGDELGLVRHGAKRNTGPGALDARPA
jgi:hypothetical protein